MIVDDEVAASSAFERIWERLLHQCGWTGLRLNKNALRLLVSGSSIRLMRRTLRIVAAAVLLVAFSLTATDSSLLLGAVLAKAGEGTCPLHVAKCCCRKICKT